MRLELAARELVPLLLICAAALTVFYFYIYRKEATQAAKLSAGRRITLWLLRITVAALVLAALSGPQTRREVVTTRPPVTAVLLDASGSMDFPASESDALVRDLGAGQRSRFNSARKAIEAIRSQLTETHDVRVYHFADSPRFLAELPRRAGPSAPAPAIRYVRQVGQADRGAAGEAPLLPDGRFSYVGSSVVKVVKQLGSEKLSAVVLLSDGQLTGGTKLEGVAREILKARNVNIPVHAVTLGSRHPLIDLSIDEVNVGSEASLGDVLTFHVDLTNQLSDSLQTTIELAEKDAAKKGAKYQPVPGFPRPLKALKRGRTTIDLAMVPEVEGMRRFRIAVPVDGREVNKDNNVAEVTVKIVKRTLRVLVVCGEPQREYFYMVPALLRDPIIQLSTFLQAADVDYIQQGNEVIERLPTTLDAWVKFDVVVLYDVDPNGLTVQQIAGVEHMVAKGGGLLVIAGRAQGLAKLIQVHAAKVRGLLPVEVDKNLHPNYDAVYDKPFEVARTRQGRNHPIMFVSSDPKTNEVVWKTFPKLFWHHPVVRAKAKAIPLLKKLGADDCLMAVQRYGEGAVFFSALDSIWLWRYPHESYDYDRFWTRAIRYLGESRLTGTQQQVALGTDKRVYAPGEKVVVELRILDPALMLQLADEKVSVEVTSPGGEKFFVQMTAATDGMPAYRGVYRPRGVGTMTVNAKQAAPEGDTSGKPLFDVTGAFEVKLRPQELVKTEANYAGMRKLAALTEGLHFCAEPNRDGAHGDKPLDELASLPERIDKTPLKLTEVYPLTLWDGWILVGLFLALVAGEWSLRKWWGLL